MCLQIICILNICMICKHILSITFLNEPELFFAYSLLVSSILI